MNDRMLITEVLGRSEQGATRPFRCRGDDGRLYYVKGKNTGWRSLCCEWVAGRLAQKAGLKTPDITIAEVPRKLIECSDRADIRDLGHGPVFASAALEGAREITWREVGHLPSGVKDRILLFDRWVHNEDRTLSPKGGNPNLLVTASSVEPAEDEIGDFSSRVESILWTFDFNLAFDTEFDTARFCENHIFSQDRLPWDQSFYGEAGLRMRAAFDRLREIWNELPEEWLYLDADDSLPPQLEYAEIVDILERPFEHPAEFWDSI